MGRNSYLPWIEPLLVRDETPIGSSLQHIFHTSVPSGKGLFRIIMLGLLRDGGSTASFDVVAMVEAVSARPFIRLD